MILRVIGMLAFTGALLGFTISLFVPHRYSASAEIAFLRPPGVSQTSYRAEVRKLSESAVELTMMPQSLELMIRRSAYFKERLYLGAFPELFGDVRKNLSISSRSFADGLSGVRIEFEDDDADTAIDLVRETLSEMGDNAAKVAGLRRASEAVRILELPHAGLTGLTPALLSGLGAAVGLLAGLIVSLVAPRPASQPVTR